MVYRRFALTSTNQKNNCDWMTLISVLCHVSPKINVVMLLVCSKLDWHKALSLDILVFIATRYNHCWGTLENLATLGTVKVQVVHVWRNHIRLVHLRYGFQTSSLTGRSIPGLRPISSRTVRNRLRDRHISHDVQQSVQLCCLCTVQLDWRGVDVIWDSENMIGPISCSQMNPVST